MTYTRRLVLDLLKPHDPNNIVFAKEVSQLEGVDGANVTLLEADKQVENIKLTVEGEDIDYEAVRQQITDLGGTVHSIDQVVCGEYFVEESKTPQD